MERFIADLVRDFERGKINRRQFCETIAVAATVYSVGEAAANAAPVQGLKAISINHISYACPDYRPARMKVHEGRRLDADPAAFCALRERW